jgi:branched-chain amino acid transport system substrate-binding protein
MSRFHRFYTLFPLILLLCALTGCAGSSAWNRQAEKQAGGTAQAEQPQANLTPLPAQEGQSVRVAVLLPLSGPNAALGQSMLQAAQMAVFDLGYDKMELTPRDTKGTATGAADAARGAISDGAQLILGPLFAEEVRSVKQVTMGSGINVIAFSTDWTIAGGNTFLMGFMPFEQVSRIASYAAERGLKRVAVAANADSYGSTASRLFEQKAREAGLQIAPALSDANSYDSVFIPAAGNDLSGILQRVSGKSAQKLGTGLWDDPRIASLPEMEGAWFAAPSPRARASFESRYAATYGGQPARIASLAYDATALSIALARSGLDRGAAPSYDAASIKNPAGFAGVDGIVRFNAQNIAERGMAVLQISGGRITEIDPAPSVFGR